VHLKIETAGSRGKVHVGYWMEILIGLCDRAVNNILNDTLKIPRYPPYKAEKQRRSFPYSSWILFDCVDKPLMGGSHDSSYTRYSSLLLPIIYFFSSAFLA
jgi:hypothetical protein